MKISIEKFIIKKCEPSDITAILQIQKEAFDGLIEPDILRRNPEEVLKSCLSAPHVTVGAWYGGVLAAFAILYYPAGEAGNPENLAASLTGVETGGLKTANYKLCIVRERFRGNSLQYELGRRLEVYAAESGVGLLCATVSPKNPYSVANITRLGFSYNRTLRKYGFERNLYYKPL
jgi:hypothetical protein